MGAEYATGAGDRTLRPDHRQARAQRGRRGAEVLAELRHPLVRVAVGAIHQVQVQRRLAPVWADVLPHRLVLGGHFEDATVRALGDQGVAVGQALRAADERAVEARGVEGYGKAGLLRRVLPLDLQRDRVDLEHARVVALRRLEAVRGAWVRGAVARPTAVVEHEQVALSR